MTISKILLLFNTVKYLKAKQIGFRVLRKFTKPKAKENLKMERSQLSGSWIVHPLYLSKFISKNSVEFLNKPGDVNLPLDWNSLTNEKLWLYNLHYFDDLLSYGSSEKNDLQLHWINKWIDENPIGQGNGWEPYPSSLRIVNWIKASLNGLYLDEKILKSLAVQTNYLSQDLEYHLLGNHLFVNAKALLMAGCFFDGKEADRWITKSESILTKEISEQILNDGGNFELSPMYHSIMLVDLLDLVNLANVYRDKFPKQLKSKIEYHIPKMICWLEYMSHCDGELSFFNDTAFGIAPTNDTVYSYAKKLGFKKEVVETDELVIEDLKSSGYVSVKSNEMSLLADLAPIGPSYIPGHAHADSLSYEFSLFGKRLIVNSGISEYGVSEERLRQRKTPAHNTVSFRELSSSEVWSGFRVARRADIQERFIDRSGQEVKFGASHNGFLKQGAKVKHTREWLLAPNFLKITDLIDRDNHLALGHLHFHPDIKLNVIDSKHASLTLAEHQIEIEIDGGNLQQHQSTWHPEFGKTVVNSKLVYSFEKPLVELTFKWNKK